MKSQNALSFSDTNMHIDNSKFEGSFGLWGLMAWPVLFFAELGVSPCEAEFFLQASRLSNGASGEGAELHTSPGANTYLLWQP